MAVIYLDECGEEGFKHDLGSNSSSEWFILSASMHTSHALPHIKSRYQEYRAKHRKQESWYFHFKNASHDERIGFIRHMRETGYQAVTVAVPKRHLEKTENFKRKYFLYFYAARYVLERATQWADKVDNGPVAILFSQRGGLSVEAARDYFKRVKTSDFVTRDHINWGRLSLDDIYSAPNRDYIGLQMADCMASAVGKAIEISEYGTTECRYVRELFPMIYRHNGNAIGHGIKFFPNIGLLQFQERFSWYQSLIKNPGAEG